MVNTVKKKKGKSTVFYAFMWVGGLVLTGSEGHWIGNLIGLVVFCIASLQLIKVGDKWG